MTKLEVNLISSPSLHGISLRVIFLHDELCKRLICVHPLYHKETLHELLFVFVTDKKVSSLLWCKTGHLLPQLQLLLLALSTLIFKQLVVLNRILCPLSVVVSEQVVRCEQVHEAIVDVVLHFPDPFAAPSHAKLGADAFTISCHHER